MPEMELPKPVFELPDGKKKRRLSIYIAIGILSVFFISLLGLYGWSLTPRDKTSREEVRVVVASGDTVGQIAKKLKQADLIRSELSFRIYTELTNTKRHLQAGGYVLSRNLSVADIIDHMSTGRTDELSVRVVPGLTLRQQYDAELEGSFAQQGFSEAEITQAFGQVYPHEILTKRPPGASLEGYIYPDTYRITANSDLTALVHKSLDEFSRVIQENGIEQQLAARGMSLHQGVTLASIIQKEVSSEADQRQVAQVFLKRLAQGMPLQSDPTFIYPARQARQEPSVQYNSPYNTYLNKGLPPGPIANFNLSALMAVVQPAEGDFLYFVADAQQVTHFARTLAEHEANVRRFCTAHCNDF